MFRLKRLRSHTRDVTDGARRPTGTTICSSSCSTARAMAHGSDDTNSQSGVREQRLYGEPGLWCGCVSGANRYLEISARLSGTPTFISLAAPADHRSALCGSQCDDCDGGQHNAAEWSGSESVCTDERHTHDRCASSPAAGAATTFRTRAVNKPRATSLSRAMASLMAASAWVRLRRSREA